MFKSYDYMTTGVFCWGTDESSVFAHDLTVRSHPHDYTATDCTNTGHWRYKTSCDVSYNVMSERALSCEVTLMVARTDVL